MIKPYLLIEVMIHRDGYQLTPCRGSHSAGELAIKYLLFAARQSRANRATTFNGMTTHVSIMRCNPSARPDSIVIRQRSTERRLGRQVLELAGQL